MLYGYGETFRGRTTLEGLTANLRRLFNLRCYRYVDRTLVFLGAMKRIHWIWREGELHPVIYERLQRRRRHWLYDKDVREFGWFVRVLSIGASVLLMSVLLIGMLIF